MSRLKKSIYRAWGLALVALVAVRATSVYLRAEDDLVRLGTADVPAVNVTTGVRVEIFKAGVSEAVAFISMTCPSCWSGRDEIVAGLHSIRADRHYVVSPDDEQLARTYQLAVGDDAVVLRIARRRDLRRLAVARAPILALVDREGEPAFVLSGLPVPDRLAELDSAYVRTTRDH